MFLLIVSSDADLLYAWRAGDTVAGQQLFKRYYAGVARFFANKLQEAPGDLVQETFMGCVEGRDRIREGGSFRSYLFGVAYRVLTSHLRRKYNAPDDLGSSTVRDFDPGPSTLMHRSEEAHLLLQALRSLPVQLQVLIELRYWEQMNSAEISHVLGIPANTVRGRLRQGRIMLEEALETMAAAPELVHNTLSDLEGWAQQVREALPLPRSQPPS
ncbi:MAG: sigma-70 family RNA polymerase sigma factor [Myxococcales bacterium]|nr:sigma-70 family RNA polymerase sigma factor [Myxococcales bacterium]